ncbi:hypothetical protein Hanom_Chr02g00104151 [Helianthus anomalus]
MLSFQRLFACLVTSMDYVRIEYTYQYIAFDHIIGVVFGFRFLQRKHRVDKLHGLSFQATTFTLILFY